jgi:hypothetical protein
MRTYVYRKNFAHIMGLTSFLMSYLTSGMSCEKKLGFFQEEKEIRAQCSGQISGNSNTPKKFINFRLFYHCDPKLFLTLFPAWSTVFESKVKLGWENVLVTKIP